MDKELSKFLTFWNLLDDTEKELLNQNAIVQNYLKGVTMHQGSGDCYSF